jgi:hypothetical protein
MATLEPTLLSLSHIITFFCRRNRFLNLLSFVPASKVADAWASGVTGDEILASRGHMTVPDRVDAYLPEADVPPKNYLHFDAELPWAMKVVLFTLLYWQPTNSPVLIVHMASALSMS